MALIRSRPRRETAGSLSFESMLKGYLSEIERLSPRFGFQGKGKIFSYIMWKAFYYGVSHRRETSK